MEMLKGVLPNAESGKVAKGEKVKSPGLKYKHYAPKAPLYRVLGTPEEQFELILDQIKNHPEKRIGVMSTEEFLPGIQPTTKSPWEAAAIPWKLLQTFTLHSGISIA